MEQPLVFDSPNGKDGDGQTLRPDNDSDSAASNPQKGPQRVTYALPPKPERPDIESDGLTTHRASKWFEDLQARASAPQLQDQPSGQITPSQVDGFSGTGSPQLEQDDRDREDVPNVTNHHDADQKAEIVPSGAPVPIPVQPDLDNQYRPVINPRRGSKRKSKPKQEEQRSLGHGAPPHAQSEPEWHPDPTRKPFRKSWRESKLESEEQQGLDEVAAPPPARVETDPRYDHSLKSNRNSAQPTTAESKEEEDLDELAAPPPTSSETGSGSSRQQTYLEDGVHEKSKQADKGPQHPNIVTQFYIICHLIFWSILGTLARLGTQWITFYPGAPVIFSNLWANFGGTLVMGFLSEDRKLFMAEWGDYKSFSNKRRQSWGEQNPRGSSPARASHSKVKKTIPLYIGLTVGFCGSFTSFSTFERDIFLALANKMSTPINHPTDTSEPTATVPRNGGYSFEAIFAVIILTITVCIGALKFGAHCAIALDRFTPVMPFRLTRRILDPLIAFLGIGCWIGAIVMAALPPDRVGGPAYAGHVETWRGQVIYALVFAPLGCLLRFYMSLKLNGLIAWFPLGTFAANIFGTAVLGMCYDLQRVSFRGMGVGGGVLGCQILQGVQDGFCGTLTTVSTWVAELTTLRRKHGYFYGSASVLVGLAMLVVVMGTVDWTVGFQTPACATETS